MVPLLLGAGRVTQCQRRVALGLGGEKRVVATGQGQVEAVVPVEGIDACDAFTVGLTTSWIRRVEAEPLQLCPAELVKRLRNDGRWANRPVAALDEVDARLGRRVPAGLEDLRIAAVDVDSSVGRRLLQFDSAPLGSPCPRVRASARVPDLHCSPATWDRRAHHFGRVRVAV